MAPATRINDQTPRQCFLPFCGIALAIAGWSVASRLVSDLPSPARTWEESKLYILEPLTKRGETDQGILLLAYYSLMRVAQGFLLGIAIATPIGFLLGVSSTLTRMFDPIMQVLRPISPLAWLPLGLVLFQKSEPAALFAIAVCSMWPTVINTMLGVRAIPQDYWNVARVLRLSKTTTFTKIIVPATLPYMFTGYRLSLGIAWLVIVASEMLTGTPGVGGFPLAGIQQPGLRAHPAGHHHHRRRRLRARSADGLAEAKLRASKRPWRLIGVHRGRGISEVIRHQRPDAARAARRLARHRAGRVRLDRRRHGQRQVDAAQPARGLTMPDGGTIAIGGEPVRGVHRHAAFVFQNYSLLPWFTALENVGSPSKPPFPS